MSESGESSDHKNGDPQAEALENERTSRETRRDARHRGEHFRHTRISAAWASTVVAVLFGVALIDFIAQNTRDVRIEFFSASGRIPVAVALIAAALLGAIVVLAVGIGRMAQLRLTMRRQRRQRDVENDANRTGKGRRGDDS